MLTGPPPKFHGTRDILPVTTRATVTVTMIRMKVATWCSQGYEVAQLRCVIPPPRTRIGALRSRSGLRAVARGMFVRRAACAGASQ